MSVIKCCVFIMLLAFTANSQSDSVYALTAGHKALKKLGVNALKQNDPVSAIFYLEAGLKKQRNDAKAMSFLGKAYFLSRDYERAQHAFLKAYLLNKEKETASLYYHALMLKSNGKYDSARINFKKFIKEYKGSDKTIKKYAVKEVMMCDSVQKLLFNGSKIVVQHLDTSINKVNSESSPINLNDSTMLFTSLRTERKEFIIEDQEEQALKKKMYYAVKAKGNWKFVGEYPGSFNDYNFNTGSIAFSPDRKRMYFTKCKPDNEGKMICALYKSDNINNSWSEPEKLPASVNNSKYSNTMPSVGSDPKTGNDIVFFVSNRKGGKGGQDIWLTVFNHKTKTYKIPVNAGSKINSANNEISPFFDNETRSLYFSSDIQNGLGGYDIYKASGDVKKWSAAVNLGSPLNSGADDVFYSISTNRQEGFFVSNRKGGNTLKNTTCCDDIYYYVRSEYVRITLAGTIFDNVNRDIKLKDTELELYMKDETTGDKFLVKSLKTDVEGNYTTHLEPDNEYYLVVKNDDYLISRGTINTSGVLSPFHITKDFVMEIKPKEPIIIPNIQYEFDRAEILESSKLCLDTTVLLLMQNNPELVIEIQSHTDSKGTDSYNLKLSQKRAESVVKYLVKKGITPQRLRAKGYGETKPVAPNENADGSDNPEGRFKNRRTDFKIIGKIDNDLIKYSD